MGYYIVGIKAQYCLGEELFRLYTVCSYATVELDVFYLLCFRWCTTRKHLRQGSSRLLKDRQTDTLHVGKDYSFHSTVVHIHGVLYRILYITVIYQWVDRRQLFMTLDYA